MKRLIALTLLLALLVTLLASCGGGTLSGTYKDPSGVTSYTFKGSKVTAEAAGMEIITDTAFEVKDGKLFIGGAEVGTYEGGTLTISGIKYKK